MDPEPAASQCARRFNTPTRLKSSHSKENDLIKRPLRRCRDTPLVLPINPTSVTDKPVLPIGPDIDVVDLVWKILIFVLKVGHMAYAIDTHASIQDLEQSGLPDKQAEAIVKLMSQQSEELVTKDYLDARLDAKIGELKVTLLATMIALTGIIIAAIKFI